MKYITRKNMVRIAEVLVVLTIMVAVATLDVMFDLGLPTLFIGLVIVIVAFIVDKFIMGRIEKRGE
jgi:hypothetical protein